MSHYVSAASLKGASFGLVDDEGGPITSRATSESRQGQKRLPNRRVLQQDSKNGNAGTVSAAVTHQQPVAATKENFMPVSPPDFKDKVVKLPMVEFHDHDPEPEDEGGSPGVGVGGTVPDKPVPEVSVPPHIPSTGGLRIPLPVSRQEGGGKVEDPIGRIPLPVERVKEPVVTSTDAGVPEAGNPSSPSETTPKPATGRDDNDDDESKETNSSVEEPLDSDDIIDQDIEVDMDLALNHTGTEEGATGPEEGPEELEDVVSKPEEGPTEPKEVVEEPKEVPKKHEDIFLSYHETFEGEEAAATIQVLTTAPGSALVLKSAEAKYNGDYGASLTLGSRQMSDSSPHLVSLATPWLAESENVHLALSFMGKTGTPGAEVFGAMYVQGVILGTVQSSEAFPFSLNDQWKSIEVTAKHPVYYAGLYRYVLTFVSQDVVVHLDDINVSYTYMANR